MTYLARATIAYRRLRQSRAGWNMAASYFSFASTSLWAIVSIPVAVHYLPRDAIGLWSVTNAFLTYLAWMDLGVSQATGRLMAPAVASNDQGEINRWWTAISSTLWIQGFAILFLGSLLTPFLIRLLGIEGAITSDAYLIILSAVVIAAISMPLRNVPGLLTAQERFHWVPIVQAFVPWCNLGVFYALLRAEWGIKAYPIAMGASASFNWLCYSLLVRLGPNRPRFDRRGLDLSRLKRLFSFSTSLMAIGFTDSVLNSLPSMILTRVGGLGLVPVYNFSSRAPFLGSSIIARTYQAFQPGWQACFVSGDRNEFLRKHEIAGFSALGLAVFGSAMVIIFNPVIVTLLAGKEFYVSPATNAWFAVGMIAFPMSAYFQSLLSLSGSMGRSAAVFTAKLPVGLGAAIAGWYLFGMAGLAAVFALLPLVNGVYGYLVGTHRCGFQRHEVSYKVALSTVASMILVLLTGLIVGKSYESTESIQIIGRSVPIPEIYPLMPTLLLGFVASGFFIYAVSKLSYEQKPRVKHGPR